MTPRYVGVSSWSSVCSFSFKCALCCWLDRLKIVKVVSFSLTFTSHARAQDSILSLGVLVAAYSLQRWCTLLCTITQGRLRRWLLVCSWAFDAGRHRWRWGQHSTLQETLPEGSHFAQVLFYLDFGFSVMHVLSSSFVRSPSNTTLAQFQFHTLFPHLVKCFFWVNLYRKCVLLVFEGVFNSFRDVRDVVLFRPILPKRCSLWCDVLFVFKVPCKSCIDEAFH